MKSSTLIAVVALLVLLAIEGAVLSGLPLSLLHFAWLPVLFSERAASVRAGLAGLALLEWSLGRTTFGAAFSTAATLFFIWHLVREDVHAESPWLALAIMPVVEALRHLWNGLFASQYGLATVAPFPWAHLLFEPILGVPLLGAWFALRRRSVRISLAGVLR